MDHGERTHQTAPSELTPHPHHTPAPSRPLLRHQQPYTRPLALKLSALHLFALLTCLAPTPHHAQSPTPTPDSEISTLKKQVQLLEQSLELQRRQVEALQKQIQALEARPQPPTSTPSASTSTATSTSATPSTSSRSWNPADPIRIPKNTASSSSSPSSYINLSLDGLFAAGGSTASDLEALQPGGHDPRQRGFTVQNLEAVLEGVVDPYFRGQANILYLLDPQGESVVELEEAYLETLHLPGGLQLKGGQFLTEFGRQNPTHPHTWDFADQSLINTRMFGEDGLRNPGARISWLVPTPFYSEVLLAIQNSHGETASSFRSETEDGLIHGRPVLVGSVRSFNDLLFTPRYATSFELTESQTLLAGASGSFGPNAADGQTRIYGLDLFWKWKPTRHHKGFPFVSWQSEAMLRHFSMADFPGDLANPALPSETLKDWGLYSQLNWGIRPGWIAGFRGDYVGAEPSAFEEIVGRDLSRAPRWRLSPNLTFLPSEFSKIRLQYNYDDRAGLGIDHSVWLQWEFLLGTHAAHKY